MTKKSWPYDILDLVVVLVTTLGAFVGALVMAVLFVAGTVECFVGAIQFANDAFQSEATGTPYGEQVTKIIHGVELLLLAPVPFLIFGALNSYLPRVRADDQEDPVRRSEICAAKKDEAHGDLLRVKGFVTGLLFALVATTSVGHALSGSLTLPGAGAAGIIMVILGTYFIALERVAMARRD